MDSPDYRKMSEITDRVRSWIPRKTEPPGNLSRDFWMPDQSCRVCYECDIQFTVFNRRHHCRICGRVFCAKCASNSIPALADECKTNREDWERIRVCNYCFKQWETGIATVNNENAASSPCISPSSSVISLATMHSGSTCNSRSTAGSIPYSTGPYQHVPYASESGENPLQSDEIFDAKLGDDQQAYRIKSGPSNSNEPFPDHFGPCIRSDDEEEDYNVWGSNSEPRPLLSDDRCYGTGNHVHINENETLRDLDSNERKDKADLQDLTLPSANAEANNSEVAGKFGLPSGVSDGVLQYDADAADCASLDFEKNAILWIPPDPEDEEDEQEYPTFGDDDDDDDSIDGAGDWGYLRSFRSLGGRDLGNRERIIEHRNAMKNLLGEHFRALISQLLQIESLPPCGGYGQESWFDIISSLSWEAATLLKPDTSKNGGMDPGIYVKVKCIASGHPSDSMVIKGVVCKKNVAHRRMTSKIDKARFLILGGALEYQRVANHLSSFDTLLQQEMDHLKMAVAKIDAHHPNVLLVEKSVSRFAQEYLLAKDISIVLNIKRPLLERIARCTGAQIVPSVDHITAQKVGYCDSFRVVKFFEEHGSANQQGKKLTKTLMFFDGCPKPLGCTILLRGANGDELKKVKRVLHYGVFAAYHLALETSFLADEGASLLELPLKSPIKVVLPGNLSSLNNSISFVPDSCASTPKEYLNPQNCIENVSTSVVCSNNSLEMKPGHVNPFNYESKEFPSEANFLNTGFVDDNNKKIINEDDNEALSLKEACPPASDEHQSILLSLTIRCELKGSVCERAHIFRITYYGNYDKPLGRFLRDNLFDQKYQCHSCEMPSEAHIHCYTHRQGSLTISVRRLKESVLPGEHEGKIWMWHRCLRCPRMKGFLPPATKRVVMSDAAWGLSFGKFLELSFSNHAAASRVASCGHSLHKDCLRFYGSGRMVACFRYAPIYVHSVYLPPPKLEFTYDGQDWIQKEANEVLCRAESLFVEVVKSLAQIFGKTQTYNGGTEPIFIQQLTQLEVMLRYEKQEFEEMLSHAIDILELNRLRRQLIIYTYVWDQRLAQTSLVNNHRNQEKGHLSSPNEKDKNVISGEKVAEKHTVSACDSFVLKFKSDVTSVQEGDGNNMDLNSSYLKEAELSHSYSSKDLVVSSKAVRRVLSEGQFPILDNLSDTLDAAWTGETLLQAIVPSHRVPFPSFYPSFNSTACPDKINSYNPLHILSFRELLNQNGARLLLPTGINDVVVPIYDDEPTSIISYALVSPDYCTQMSKEYEKPKDVPIWQSIDEAVSETLKNIGATTDELDGLHVRLSFSDEKSPMGKVKYTVTCYYAKRFQDLRQICCRSELEFVRSLSRCKKWGAQGGKSNVFFAKTLDERFIIKQVTKTELDSFIKFAPSYFKYLSDSINTGCPTCLAKILGIYQVTTKHVKGGKETRMDVLVMENLLYRRDITRLYDLKGSSRSRYNPDSSGSNKVLLDQNLLETIPTSPIFVGTQAKRLLERAVWNDTQFLASVDVMDYSLLVGVDEEKHELVLGVIDFMRQYTWDKHLETWVKASGILGGPKNTAPTVISPIQYKKRFRKAMSAYFLMVPPHQWSSSSSSSIPFSQSLPLP